MGWLSLPARPRKKCSLEELVRIAADCRNMSLLEPGQTALFHSMNQMELNSIKMVIVDDRCAQVGSLPAPVV